MLELDPGIELYDTYLKPSTSGSAKKATKTTGMKDLVDRFCKTDELMSKSVLKPGIEQQSSLPAYFESKRQIAKQKKIERQKTKGEKWYNLPATPMTEEAKNDLTIIQMRSILNPKHFYKKNDLKVLPKYFQVGTVLDDASDFYHSRVPNKQRKKTLVDELLDDADFRRKNKVAFQRAIRKKRNSRVLVRRPNNKLTNKRK